MPRILSTPKLTTAPRTELQIENLRGVDLSNAPANVEDFRSPDAKNMIPDQAGKPVKRTGYFAKASYPDRINGYFYLREVATEERPAMLREVVHAGTKLYDGDEELYDGMADVKSTAVQIMGYLWIIDGTRLLRFGYNKETEAYEVKTATEVATVPMVVISRNPTGGGTPYDNINLLSSKWTESFLGTAADKVYQLSFGNLDDTPVTAKKLSGSDWVDLAEGTDFTVNRETGAVTFTVAPGVPPVTGQDNVRITASREFEGYADRINGCDVGILYGVAGASDRLFLTGNPKFPNLDWFSEQNNPAFFGDLSYSQLGQDSSRIVGYSIMQDKLAAHKDNAEDGRNVILRSGTIVNSKAAFPIATTWQSAGAIARHSFAFLSSEPLYLTANGIYAITSEDVTGDRYAQNRSFFINKRLTAEPNLNEADCCIYRNFYMLAVNGHVYILNGAEKAFSRNEPFSTFQYECYYWEPINARRIWSNDEVLYFGTDTGEVMEFYTNAENLSSYNDNGEPIDARLDTADLDGKLFFHNKTFKYLSVQLAPAVATGVTTYALIKGQWVMLREESARARYFSFSQLTFSKLSFSTDTTPRTLVRKYKIKKVDKVRFRFENKTLNEPFGIYKIGVGYTERGIYKK